ncbi:amyloid beta A4 precursor protein-binding family B member 1-interacting protein-like [Hypomesus transpacificus]|uniref:amyloid beta A4 precursor protein-binding family B member 1-interacting protein-like n=1 Tax=Hypomesus transpacificus TaxID=137520 RepID=UPI001F0776B3|nr:amyloid beta A4 precursor protein-binding family B member 1-interacting protein-like [Hypomesus transpacificus]
MEDVDTLFTDLLGEMDLLTQSMASEVISRDVISSIGFSDLNESLQQLEDRDLDALMADLGSELGSSQGSELGSSQGSELGSSQGKTSTGGMTWREDSQWGALPPPPPPLSNTSPGPGLGPPGPGPGLVLGPGLFSEAEQEAQAKADKIKLALHKIQEAKIRKLVVRVFLEDGSSKTLMVDERQTVRDVLDDLFEKTHCDHSLDWSLCESNPDLQAERGFEDHEKLVEALCSWTRDSSNTISFLRRTSKYSIFTQPQVFYQWRKSNHVLNDNSERQKDILLKENFEGGPVRVPDLEGPLFLKEDGKKSWKRRYFLLRPSGIYYVPKGKTKTSTDLACLLQLDQVNIYTTSDYRQRLRAPTDHCFILKHPRIQRESRYVRFLCCEDELSLLQWVASIRVTKYGAVLYKSYQAALRTASTFSSTPLTCLTVSAPTTPSSQPRARRTNEEASQTCQSTPISSSSQIQPMAEDIQDDSEPPPDFKPPPPPGRGSNNV